MLALITGASSGIGKKFAIQLAINDAANVRFGMPSVSAEYIVRYSLKKMSKNKLVITPSLPV